MLSNGCSCSKLGSSKALNSKYSVMWKTVKVYFTSKKINLRLYDMGNSAQYLLKVNNNSTRIGSFDTV